MSADNSGDNAGTATICQMGINGTENVYNKLGEPSSLSHLDEADESRPSQVPVNGHDDLLDAPNSELAESSFTVDDAFAVNFGENCMINDGQVDNSAFDLFEQRNVEDAGDAAAADQGEEWAKFDFEPSAAFDSQANVLEGDTKLNADTVENVDEIGKNGDDGDNDDDDDDDDFADFVDSSNFPQNSELLASLPPLPSLAPPPPQISTQLPEPSEPQPQPTHKTVTPSASRIDTLTPAAPAPALQQPSSNINISVNYDQILNDLFNDQTTNDVSPRPTPTSTPASASGLVSIDQDDMWQQLRTYTSVTDASISLKFKWIKSELEHFYLNALNVQRVTASKQSAHSLKTLLTQQILEPTKVGSPSTTTTTTTTSTTHKSQANVDKNANSLHQQQQQATLTPSSTTANIELDLSYFESRDTGSNKTTSKSATKATNSPPQSKQTKSKVYFEKLLKDIFVESTPSTGPKSTSSSVSAETNSITSVTSPTVEKRPIPDTKTDTHNDSSSLDKKCE